MLYNKEFSNESQRCGEVNNILLNKELIISFLEYISIAGASGFLLSLIGNIRYIGLSIALCIASLFLYSMLGVVSSAVFWVFLLFEAILFSKKMAESILAASLSVGLYILINYLVGFGLQQFSLIDRITDISIFALLLTLYFIAIAAIKKILRFMTCYGEKNFLIWFSAALAVITTSSYFTVVIYDRVYGKTTSFGHTNLFFINLYGITFLVASIMAGFAFKERSDLKRKKQDEIYMQEYIESLEKTSLEIRRFKHDYQNILLSMKDYFDSDDIEGLNHFYESHLVHAIGSLNQHALDLSKFANLNIREIKSLLISKVLQAQGKEIETSVEVPKKIDNIEMDIITLIRCLGIILDNAIEASFELENGWLKIGFICNNEHSIDIIVENSCSSSIPPFHKLKMEGFSTKGVNRGMGLSNLELLVAKSNCCSLETQIVNDTFTQIIHIHGRDVGEDFYL
ncbi:GHKL domain-containing protein [Candidatus Enterococcus courvalinii]|uniref:GHKL domain-containing protein n=1 Tax=Candidatus Enterococcus courvalinii TaxID=2815329 RepID=A0ABS3HZB9_9ENTE|nr:GHKL domain-containing protein [Enterococcus sp. MSG2901]MBO0481272.1 GHKL domain-containing protein [Enterococcus sp. MSG2901]